VHDLQAVGERLGLLEVVRRDEDRRALRPQVEQDAPHVTAALGVQAGRRLVEDDELVTAHERAREVDPARLAARQRSHPDVGAVLERQQLEHLVDGAGR
jgi:hypothetical protein